jgi:hypothetical protein
MIGIGTNVEWVGTIGAGPLLGVKRKLAYAPRQRGFSSVLDPKRPSITEAAPPLRTCRFGGPWVKLGTSLSLKA